jgi:hypothetical protein
MARNDSTTPPAHATTRPVPETVKPLASPASDDPYGDALVDALRNDAPRPPIHMADLVADTDSKLPTAYALGYAAALRELTAALPHDLATAQTNAHAALLRWRGLSDEALVAANAFYRHDVLGGAVRVRCAADLATDRFEGDVLIRKGLAATVADKAASDHPEYVAHKAETQRLGAAKAAAENAATQALETLHNAREYLRAHIARSMLRSSGFPDDSDIVTT